MRLTIALAVLSCAVLVVAGWGYIATQSRIDELEDTMGSMDTNLKQFAVPMEDLRRDISAIYAELDEVSPAGADERAAAASSSSPPPDTRQRDQPPRSAVRPAPIQQLPTGPVYYGNQMSTFSYDGSAPRDPRKGLRYSQPSHDDED